MKLFGLSKALVLSPHPDDAEYSMAGTIMKYSDTEFIIVNMSSGGDYDLTGPVRITEANTFWSSFKNASVAGSRLTFVKGHNDDELVSWVENLNLQFDAIFVPPGDDFHFEHRIINSVGRALSRKKLISVIEYNTPSASHEWYANMFVDITEVYEKKKELLISVFETQRARSYFTQENIDAFHTNYFCNKRSNGFNELFKVDFLFI